MNRDYKHKYVPLVIAHFSTGGISSMYEDEVFNADRPEIVLRYGRHSLSPKYKTRLWRSRLDAGSEKGGSRLKHRFFVAYYSLLQKVQERMGINQDVLH